MLTPQNRFGRQGGGVRGDVAHRRGGGTRRQVRSTRSSASGIRATPCATRGMSAGSITGCASTTTAGRRSRRRLSWRARVKERARRRMIHAVDRYLLTRNVTKRRGPVTDHPGAAASVGLDSLDRGPSTAAPTSPTAATTYGEFVLVVSRLTPAQAGPAGDRVPARAGRRRCPAGRGRGRRGGRGAAGL